VSPALETLGIAKSSVNCANAAVLMNGTLKVAGKTVKVEKWPGEQSHTWGSRRVDLCAWAHSNAFAEDPGALFEGISGQAHKLGIALPLATPLYLRLSGTPEAEEHAWTGIGSIFSNRSTFKFGRWEFEAEGSGMLMKGVATTSLEKAICVEYEDPNGDRIYSHHSTGGDLEIDIYRRVGARWSLERKLTSKGGTAFEYMARERDPRAGRTLLLSQARMADEALKPAGVSS
jgi:hypothetical protein